MIVEDVEKAALTTKCPPAYEWPGVAGRVTLSCHAFLPAAGRRHFDSFSSQIAIILSCLQHYGSIIFQLLICVMN